MKTQELINWLREMSDFAGSTAEANQEKTDEIIQRLRELDDLIELTVELVVILEDKANPLVDYLNEIR